MRLRKHLTESTDMVALFNKYEDEIDKNCQPYIRMIKHSPNILVRSDPKLGLYDVHRKFVRTNRRPMDMSDDMHNKIDEFFLKKFGWRARSNVVFCKGNKRKKIFSFLLFPIGKFKFLWSPKVNDLYNSDLKNMYSHYYKEWNDIKDTYIDNDFRKALSSEHEIMINCKEYYLLPPGISTLVMTRFIE